MTVQDVSEKLGGRKIAVWLVLLLFSTILLWFGKIESEQWAQLQTWTTMSLLAANAFTHFAQNFKK